MRKSEKVTRRRKIYCDAMEKKQKGVFWQFARMVTLIPTEGIFYSQAGNKYFPVREHLMCKKVGERQRLRYLKLSVHYWWLTSGYYWKMLHLSRRMAPSPLNKGISPFPSLPSSLPSPFPYLSYRHSLHFPDTSIDVKADTLTRDGRDEGEIWEG